MSRGSMHKRAVECRFLEFCVDMAKWPLILKVKINDPHFQYQPRESLDAYLVQSGSFYFFTSYCVDKPRFLEFWVKMAKMTLKIKVNDLHFQYQPRVSQDACLVQVLEFKCEYLCRWGCGVIFIALLSLIVKFPHNSLKPILVWFRVIQNFSRAKLCGVFYFENHGFLSRLYNNFIPVYRNSSQWK